MMRTSRRLLDGKPWLLALLPALAAAFSLQACGGDDLKCGGPFCVSPGPPEATTLKAGPGEGQTGAPGRELPRPIVVRVTDDDDRPIADVQVSFSVSQGGGSVSDATIRSDIEGRAQVSWTLGPDAGTQSVQAAASKTSGTPLSGSPLTISAVAVRPPPRRVVLQTPPPETARNGVQFERQPVVAVLDADDQSVSQVQVTASIASGGGTLNGTTVVSSDAAGQATFPDLAIIGTTGRRTLRFSVTDPALEVASGPVELQPGGAAQITGVAPLSYEVTVGSPVSPAPSVLVKDGAGNPVPGVAVTFTADRDASVSPLTVTTDAAGVARVTTWTLGTSANVPYSLTARITSSSLNPVSFSAMARPGAALRLQIATQPSSSAQNGAPLVVQPVIQVTDRNGNPTPEANLRVTASVTTGSGTLKNSTATTDGSGRATFSGLTITGKVDNYILAFSATGLEGVPSNVIALAAGPAAKLVLASVPPSAHSRARLDPQPSLQVQDASGNSVGQAGILVTAALTGGGTLGGQATATTDGTGRATFGDLTITGAPGSGTLSFSSTSPVLDGASVPVALPPVASIEIQVPLAERIAAGATVSLVPTWILKDAQGQPVPDAPATVSASAGTIVPSGPVTSDANGVVQVQSWTLGTTAGEQFVDLAVAPGLSSSDTTLAVADVPTFLVVVSGNHQTAPPDSALADLLVVRVTDQYGNGVQGIAIQWRGCEGGGGFDDVTAVDGSSAARQPTGPQTGQFCTRATSVPDLDGSPVQFDYTVQAQTTPPSQLRGSRTSGVRPRGLAPVAPPRTSVTAPTSR